MSKRSIEIPENPYAQLTEDVYRLVREVNNLRYAVNHSLALLRVCHLANRKGSQIKVDQAMKVLERAMGILERSLKENKEAEGMPLPYPNNAASNIEFLKRMEALKMEKDERDSYAGQDEEDLNAQDLDLFENSKFDQHEGESK